MKRLLFVLLSGCIGYNSTVEKAKISDHIFVNGFYGQTIISSTTPTGKRSFLEYILNLGFEKHINERIGINFNLTSQNHIQKYENFHDTTNYLRINFGVKNVILNSFSFKAELIYDVDLNARPLRLYNQKYMYGIGKFIFDYRDFSILFSLNSLSVCYHKKFFSFSSGLYFRPDYSVPILNVGLGLRK
ncbi:MAG: hypothetical protein N2504_05950 [candidate division WOR-3 bacterium]|nr:hypothetical protein [candidate division WOR-3 bacterium]